MIYCHFGHCTLLAVLTVVVREESPYPRGSSRTNLSVLVLVLFLGSQVLVLVLDLEESLLGNTTGYWHFSSVQFRPVIAPNEPRAFCWGVSGTVIGLVAVSITAAFLYPGTGPQRLWTLLLLFQILLGFLLLSDFQIPNTFPFLTQSWVNFGCWLIAVFLMFVQCRIFKLSPNYLVSSKIPKIDK